MEIKPLYRFLREDGGFTESPDKPDVAEYTTRYRLIASDGKLLTNGTTETYCIDVDSVDGWSEICGTDTYTREALEAMTNADLEIILAGMGISANMTKANMVTLILAMQGGDAL
ncbi:MAG: hypothetical protein PUJ93_02225 [Oscillospiraceae bacterium]|nr:hypothetical protein [Oscillospiraceae bacterium]